MEENPDLKPSSATCQLGGNNNNVNLSELYLLICIKRVLPISQDGFKD